MPRPDSYSLMVHHILYKAQNSKMIILSNNYLKKDQNILPYKDIDVTMM